MKAQHAYDRVADEYARRVFDELRHKPLDRALLDRFAASVGGAGLVCDLGCGPGHVARYLHERGLAVCGVDLSPALVALARQLTPAVEFHQGDMTALDVPDGAWAGIVAFYCLIHIPRGEVVQTLRELRRVLQPGALLLLNFHIGDAVLHLDEWWGRAVDVDFVQFQPAEMSGYLTEAGFVIDEVIERDPYPDVEYQSRRCYIFARRAAEIRTP